MTVYLFLYTSYQSIHLFLMFLKFKKNIYILPLYNSKFTSVLKNHIAVSHLATTSNMMHLEVLFSLVYIHCCQLRLAPVHFRCLLDCCKLLQYPRTDRSHTVPLIHFLLLSCASSSVSSSFAYLFPYLFPYLFFFVYFVIPHLNIKKCCFFSFNSS